MICVFVICVFGDFGLSVVFGLKRQNFGVFDAFRVELL